MKEHPPTDYCPDELIELENKYRKLCFTVSVLSDQYLAAKQKFLDSQREVVTVESNCL